MTSEPRIPLPQPGELRADAEQLVAAIAQPGREPAKTMAVLAYQPDLLSPFLGWAAALALNGVLSNRAHELLALRAASNCRWWSGRWPATKKPSSIALAMLKFPPFRSIGPTAILAKSFPANRSHYVRCHARTSLHYR